MFHARRRRRVRRRFRVFEAFGADFWSHIRSLVTACCRLLPQAGGWVHTWAGCADGWMGWMGGMGGSHIRGLLHQIKMASQMGRAGTSWGVSNNAHPQRCPHHIAHLWGGAWGGESDGKSGRPQNLL